MTDHSNEGLVHMSYDCDELGVVLDCWFEYEPAERGSREFGTGLQLEPDYPATWTLYHVYLPGSSVDIASVLLLSLVEEIEVWAQEMAEQKRQDSFDDWGDE